MITKLVRRYLAYALSISLLLVLLGTGTAQAALPGIAGNIAFHSNRDGNYEIYTMSPDGSNQTRLTNSSANDMNPAWSPDGKKIAFQSDENGNSQIYVINSDGSSLIRLTNSNAYDGNPAWSPDGSKIAFIRSFGPISGDVYVMNSDGSNVSKLTNYTAGSFPDAFTVTWSPDGTKIAYSVSLSDTQQEIYTMNTDGSGMLQLTNNSVLSFSPSWSPDGTKIAFNRSPAGSAAIYTMNSDGSNQVSLTGSLDSSATWSPDGTKIAFQSGRDGNGEIYLMTPDGSGQTRLTFNSAEDGHPDWQNFVYGFSGFFQPVDNPPTLNAAKAGSAIPVKFSLGGDQGLGIFAPGYPKSQQILCDSDALVDGIEQTVAAGSSSLSYDAVTNQYTYVWKTDRLWINTCRQLVFKLIDGTYHRANFKFK